MQTQGTQKPCCLHAISERIWLKRRKRPMLSRKAVSWCTCKTVLPRQAVGHVYILQAQLYYGSVPIWSVAIPFLKLNLENISSSDVSSVVITLENINHVLVHLPCIYLWHWRTVLLPARQDMCPFMWWLFKVRRRWGLEMDPLPNIICHQGWRLCLILGTAYWSYRRLSVSVYFLPVPL